MGDKFLIRQTKRGLIQVPIAKYTMLGEEGKEIDLEEVKKLSNSLGLTDIDLEQLFEGTKMEAKEHPDVIKNNLENAVRIAASHLKEIPDYYSRLQQMEIQAKEQTAEKISKGGPGSGRHKEGAPDFKGEISDHKRALARVNEAIARGEKGWKGEAQRIQSRINASEKDYKDYLANQKQYAGMRTAFSQIK